MLSYYKGGTAEKKRSRSQRDDDDAGEETSQSQKKKVEESPLTQVRAVRPLPTKEELETYMSVAKKLHKNGTLELIDNMDGGGSTGQARMVEKMKLSNIMTKEKVYYKNLKDRCIAGEKDYDKTDLHVDSAIFKAERLKCVKRLNDLNDHTLDTIAIDKSMDTTDDSGQESEIFTEEEETENDDEETETETEKEDETESELETLEITIM